MRSITTHHARLLIALLGIGASVGCSGKSAQAGADQSLIDEPIDTSRWRDAKALKLDDLMSEGADFIRQDVQDQLTDPFSVIAKLKVDKPSVFGTAAIAATDPDAKKLDELVSGLIARYGKDDFSTQVNQARLDYLSSGTSDKVYVESAFHLEGGFGADELHSWDIAAKGLFEAESPVSITVGFDADADIDSRVIVAFGDDYKSRLGTDSKNPLAAIKRVRGFMYPRSLDDVKAMKPGESFAVNGHGKLGANVGVSVPIFAADPTTMSFKIAFSAGVRTELEGELDVQVIRMQGNTVVLDVGIDKARVVGANVALKDEFGVEGLIDAAVKIGESEVSLDKLVGDAISDIFDKYLGFDAHADLSKTHARTTITRLRFDLGAPNADEVTHAFAQAMRGDVRLAEALYNRDQAQSNPSVVVDFDIFRSGEATTRELGVDIFGMTPFHNVLTQTSGSLVEQSPAGARSVLFNSLHNYRHLFERTHGYERIGLAGLDFNAPNTVLPTGEANLFMALLQADDHMHDPIVLDNIDAVIAAIAGDRALAILDENPNELMALDAFKAAIASIDDEQKDLALKAAHVHAALRMAGIKNGTRPSFNIFTGPGANLVVDYRLGDAALAELATKNGEDFKNALTSYLNMYRTHRTANPQPDAVMKEVEEDWGDGIRNMAQVFETKMKLYTWAQRQERRTVQLGGGVYPIGARGIVLDFKIDKDKRPIYEQATLQSVAQKRAQIMTQMFDELADLAGDIKEIELHREGIVAYPLMKLVSPANADLSIALDVNTDDCDDPLKALLRTAEFESFDAHAVGKTAQNLESGGLVSLVGGAKRENDGVLDALISVQKEED